MAGTFHKIHSIQLEKILIKIKLKFMSKDKFFKKINLRDFDRSINWRKKIANDQKLLAKNFQNQLGNEISCQYVKMMNQNYM